ncbi:MAG: sugar phosphate isomerase/epimerase [Rhizobiales bacterium]|nr:sugar phosphate isomerase/epimerase [Hyphomicrobiales bacterium]
MASTAGRNNRVMWLANVRAVPYRERIEATARAGFGWISTSPRDYEKTRASGLSDAEIRAIAADNGVRLSYLDPFASWVPDAISPDEDPAIIPYLDTTPDEMFRIAEALQVDRIHFVGAYKPGRYSTAELTEYFGKMCDRASAHGLKCVIEGIAMWGLCRLDEAWAIVRDAGRPNTGIIFDTWHYTRVGRTDHIFAEIPPALSIPSRLPMVRSPAPLAGLWRMTAYSIACPSAKEKFPTSKSCACSRSTITSEALAPRFSRRSMTRSAAAIKSARG